MTKLLRIFLAALLVCSPTLSTAHAGRLLGLLGGLGGDCPTACSPVLTSCEPACGEPVACEPAVVCCEPPACEPSPCEPAALCCGSEDVVIAEELAGDCGCNGADQVVEHAVVEHAVEVDHAPATESMPTPAPPQPSAMEGSGSRVPTPPAAALPPVPSETDPAPQPPVEPQLFATEPADVDPVDAGPTDIEPPVIVEATAEKPMPLDEDLPLASEPAGQGDEDLFAAPSEPSADDDLFGPEPAAPVAEPAMPADDDLFGDGVPAADDGGLFDEPTDAPSEPADDDDDLFGEADPQPAAEEDDLFAEPAESGVAADGDDGDDDLFGDIADEVLDKSDDADDGFDLFNDAREPVDPFERLRDPGGLRSNEMRWWTDNSGLYRTLGRLSAVEQGAVRLVTAEGNTAVVPVNRLSGADIDFVEKQKDLSRIERIARTALR